MVLTGTFWMMRISHPLYIIMVFHPDWKPTNRASQWWETNRTSRFCIEIPQEVKLSTGESLQKRAPPSCDSIMRDCCLMAMPTWLVVADLGTETPPIGGGGGCYFKGVEGRGEKHM